MNFQILKNKTFQHFLVYLSSGGISRALPFLVLIAITNYLSREDFGLVSNFFVLVQLFSAIIGLKLLVSFQAEFYQNDESGRRLLTVNIIFLQMLIAATLAMIVLIFHEFIITQIKLNGYWIGGALFLACSINIFQLRSNILRLEEKPKSFAAFQIVDSFLNALLTVLFVIILQLSWEGRIYAAMITGLIMLILSGWYLVRQGWLKAPIEKKIVAEQFKLGAPLMPQVVTPFLRKGMDKLILTGSSGLAANGIYSFAMSFGSVIHMVMDSFFATAIPGLYKSMSVKGETTDVSNEKKRSLARNILKGAGALLIVLFIGYFVLYAGIILLFNRAYHEAVYFLPFIMIEIFFQSMSKFFSAFIIYSKKTIAMGSLIFTIGIFHTLLSFALIPTLGIYGALYALIIAEGTKFLLIIYLSNRYFPLPWRGVFQR